MVSAFGCRSVVPPEGAMITRHGDDVAVVCNQSLEVFYVRPTQPPTLDGTGNDYRPKVGDALRL